MKKNISVIICAVMLAFAVTGCKNVDADTLQDAETLFQEDIEQQNNAQSSLHGDADQHSQIDYDAAFAVFAPETAMIIIGDYTVTWAELFFYLRGNINQMISGFMDVDDWTQQLYYDMSFADIILLYSLDNARMYKAFEYGARASGVSLQSEDYEAMNDEFVQMSAYYGGEEEFLKYMWEEDGCHNRELLDYLLGISYLADRTFKELYGESGEKISDEICNEAISSAEFLMAKHILLSETGEGEKTALELANELLNELNEYEGDNFDACFNDMMNEHSSDNGGLISYPSGYLFQNGDMVEEFYEACAALDIGEVSGAVESFHGVHIIYRIPIDFDVVPIAFSMQGDYRTLRAYVAQSLFDLKLSDWLEGQEPIFTDSYNSMDVAAIFGKA